MAEQQVAAQEEVKKEVKETAAQEEVEQEETSSAEDLFEELPVEEDDTFDDTQDFSDINDADEELDEDKRTKDYWKKRADFYERKAQKVDSIEAVDKAIKKYSLTSPEIIDHLREMAKKGRRQNEINEFARFANKLINAERNQLKAQVEKTYGSLDNLKVQAKEEAQGQVADAWGRPDVGNKAPDTLVDWEQIKNLPVHEQLKYADKLKPVDKGWIGSKK